MATADHPARLSSHRARWQHRARQLIERITSARASRAAATVFAIRAASAVVIYLSQIVLARWMGRDEFGVYVYVWTLTLVVGDLLQFGLGYSAQRFIPEYTQNRSPELLRGFLFASRWFIVVAATLAAGGAFLFIWTFHPGSDAEMIPLYLACLALPLYALSDLSDGIARTYNWVTLALAPLYLLRPTLMVALALSGSLFGLAPDAVTGMAAAAAATWITALLQLAVLQRRLARAVPAGPRAYDARRWVEVSAPIFLVFGFYTLFTYTDVIVLQLLRPSAEVAVYFAAVKTLAPIAFINFSVVAVVAHRFAEHHVAGAEAEQRHLLAGAVRGTFWLSLAALAALLPLGWLMLALFGPGFEDGYPLLFILALGLLARAAVGPAERLLNMAGEQRRCTLIYAAAFAANLACCLMLIPTFHMYGAAMAVCLGMMVEAALLFITVKRRLGLHAFVFFAPPNGRR